MKRSVKKSRPSKSTTLEGPEPPAGRPHKSVQDARAHFAALTAKQPVDEAFRTAFMQSKITLVHTHPALDIATRDGSVEDEGWRVRKDGSHFWANVVITALRDESGALVGFAKVTRDLTERRGAELALRTRYYGVAIGTNVLSIRTQLLPFPHGQANLHFRGRHSTGNE